MAQNPQDPAFPQRDGLIHYLEDRLCVPRIAMVVDIVCWIGGIIILSEMLPAVFSSDSYTSRLEAKLAQGEGLYYGIFLLFAAVMILLWEAKPFALQTLALHALKDGEYTVTLQTVADKRPAGTKAPYFVLSPDGDQCECPVFLDHKKLQIGDEILCVHVAYSYYAYPL